MPGDCSRITGHYYLSYHYNNPANPSYVNPNEPIIMECKTLRNVVRYTSEAETGGLFINSQNVVPIQTALIELDHLQPKTPFKTDKSTSKGYSKKSK